MISNLRHFTILFMRAIGRRMLKFNYSSASTVSYVPRRYLDQHGTSEFVLYGEMEKASLVQVRGIGLMTGCEITTLDASSSTNSNRVVIKIVGPIMGISKCKFLLVARAMIKCHNINENLMGMLSVLYGDNVIHNQAQPPNPDGPKEVSKQVVQPNPLDPRLKLKPHQNLLISHADEDIDDYDFSQSEQLTVIFLGTEELEYNLPSVVSYPDALLEPVNSSFGAVKEIRLRNDANPRFATISFRYNKSVIDCVTSPQPFVFKIRTAPGSNHKESVQLQAIRYRPGDDECTRDERALFIESLSDEIKTEHLKSAFEKFGSIVMIRIYPDNLNHTTPVDNLRKRCAFVVFNKRGPVVACLQVKWHNILVNGKKVQVYVDYYTHAKSAVKQILNPLMQLFSNNFTPITRTETKFVNHMKAPPKRTDEKDLIK